LKLESAPDAFYADNIHNENEWIIKVENDNRGNECRCTNE